MLERGEFGRNARVDVARGGAGAGVLEVEGDLVAADEGQASREGLEEHHTRGEPIRCGRRRLAKEGLRGPVLWRARDAVPLVVEAVARLEGGGGAEVEDHHAPFGRDLDVVGLEVAVHRAADVEGVDPERELERRAGEAAPGKLGAGLRGGCARGADVCEEGFPSHQLHREKRLRRLDDELVEGHQVGVFDPRARAKLPAEEVLPVGPGRLTPRARRERLECDLTLAKRVEGPVHRAASPGPQGLDHDETVGPVVAEMPRGGPAAGRLRWRRHRSSPSRAARGTPRPA